MIIGRGHTVYIDNKSMEYNGQSYKSPYKVVVFVDGEQVAKLRDKERGMARNRVIYGIRRNRYGDLPAEYGQYFHLQLPHADRYVLYRSAAGRRSFR